MMFFTLQTLDHVFFGGVGKGNAVVILDHFSEIILDFLEGLRCSDVPLLMVQKSG